MNGMPAACETCPHRQNVTRRARAMTYMRTECTVYATWQETCGCREREAMHAREETAETLAVWVEETT